MFPESVIVKSPKLRAKAQEGLGQIGSLLWTFGFLICTEGLETFVNWIR